MAKNVRDPTTAANNWSSRTGAASTFWASQVQASTWKAYAGSDQAEKNFNAAMTNVLAKKGHQTGVQSSSDAAWQGGVASTGVQRFAPGVTAAAPKMQAVMNKLIPDIKAAVASLPPRGVAGDPANYARSQALGTALHNKKGQYKAKGVAKATS